MKYILPLTLVFIISCANPGQKSNTQSDNSERIYGPIGEEAMISSAHPLATKVGVDILKKGGNAFDAALGVHFALAVVFPRAGNIGGGGFAVFRKTDGEIGGLDFREKAPFKAHRDMYLDEVGDAIPEMSRIGHMASGVPGSVDGILTLHEKHGTMPLQALIQPAIDLAYNGYELTEDAAFQLNRFKEEFATYNGEDFFLSVKDWAIGDRIRYEELAGTLAAIRDRGRAGFYEGIVADQIVKEMQSGGGIITLDDLKSYKSVWRDPVIGAYRDHKIISMAPPSSGGVALIQLLQGAEPYNIGAMGHNTKATIHLMTELERRVYADRATHLGDPDFYEVPVEMLTDNAYNEERFSSVSLAEKTDSKAIKEGEVEVIESVETTHYSIVDADGNAVSITTTLNGFFGCKVMVKGAGFFLNNEMDDFSAKPGSPNMFGLIGGEANAIEPEKRMLSSMTPTIVEKNNQLKMVVGTPGGSTIITCVFQTIMNVIDHDMTMQEAVNAKKTHSQWLPDMIIMEEGLDSVVTVDLEKMGHELMVRDKLGRMDCILVHEDGTLEGGADVTRGDNYAEGY